MDEQAVVMALQNADAKERAAITAFNICVNNIRNGGMSARAANRLLLKAKDEYALACQELHKVMRAVREEPTGPIRWPNREA